jgi:hypothetical protein
METNGSISTDEATAALASVRESRTRVAWCGYPAWYWLTTGAGLGALTYAALLPGWATMAISVLIGVLLIGVAHAASRARGIREGCVCVRGAMTRRDRLVLGGPAALMIIVSAAAAEIAGWPSLWPSIVAAVLVGVLFAGTGLILSARAARR